MGDNNTVMCPQEEHDACECAKTQPEGIYTPYVFDVSEEVLKNYCVATYTDDAHAEEWVNFIRQ